MWRTDLSKSGKVLHRIKAVLGQLLFILADYNIIFYSGNATDKDWKLYEQLIISLNTK